MLLVTIGTGHHPFEHTMSLVEASRPVLPDGNRYMHQSVHRPQSITARRIMNTVTRRAVHRPFHVRASPMVEVGLLRCVAVETLTCLVRCAHECVLRIEDHPNVSRIINVGLAGPWHDSQPVVGQSPLSVWKWTDAR